MFHPCVLLEAYCLQHCEEEEEEAEEAGLCDIRAKSEHLIMKMGGG